jgi:hypothetical protein
MPLYIRMPGRKIIACYLRAGSDVLEDHMLNRLAAYTAPRYEDARQRNPVVHVELYFPDAQNRDTGLSAGICYGGQVFMHPKRFSRTSWEFHSIPVTEAQLLRAKSFCDRQRGAPFNYRGFFVPRACGLGHRYRTERLSTHKMPWYCSELVAYALLHAGILDEDMTLEASAHPNAAYHVIESRCSTFIDCARNISSQKLEL